MTDSILQDSYKIIAPHNHPTPKCPCKCADICTLKRLLDKKLTGGAHGNPAKFSFSENEIASERQTRTVEELKPFTGHNRNVPYSTDGALVMVNYNGQDFLLDGNNRVNFWHAKGEKSKRLEINYHRIGGTNPSTVIKRDMGI